MLKILQARLQQYLNCELPYVQAEFGKGRGTKGQEFQKNINFCFIDYAKAFDYVITTNWKILKEMEYQTT